MKMPLNYYLHDDVLHLSRDLLGKWLLTSIEGIETGGMITETEAYRAPDDRASHAYGNKKTKRNAVMYLDGGIAYVYKCYGIHTLFNVVTNQEEIPHAILIRAIEPTDGVETMLNRRARKKLDTSLANGPGKLTQALGIDTSDNGTSLNSSRIWIEDRDVVISSSTIITGPRIGIDYAGADALLPWRFRIKPDSCSMKKIEESK